MGLNRDSVASSALTFNGLLQYHVLIGGLAFIVMVHLWCNQSSKCTRFNDDDWFVISLMVKR